jgi:hypothetical protein
MKIFTAHWKHYTDDVYADYNRKMFINESDGHVFDAHSIAGVKSAGCLAYYVATSFFFIKTSTIASKLKEGDRLRKGWVKCDHACRLSSGLWF